METRANYALIGAFTLAVIASAFLFVFWFSGGEKAGGRKTYRIIFTGSVSGLSRGSQVLFNGLRVGEVTSLGLMDEDPSRVAALVEVVANTPVKVDTHAKLEFTGVTGIAAIALAGGGADTGDLYPRNGETYPVIYGDKSDLQNLLSTVQTLSSRVDSILGKADGFLGEGDGSIREILKNTQVFSKALSDNADGVGQALKTVSDLGRSLQPVGAKIESLATNLDGVVKAVEPQRVASIVKGLDVMVNENGPSVAATLKNAETISKALADPDAGVAKALLSLNDIATILQPVAGKLGGLVDNTTAVIAAIDAAKVSGIVDDASAAARQLNGSAGKIASLTDQAGAVVAAVDSAKVKGIVDDAADVSRNAATASRALADPAAGVGKLLSSFAGIASDVQPVAAKIGALADTANLLVGAIDAGKINGIVGDASEAARKLNGSADAVAALAGQAGAVVAAVDSAKVKGIVDDVADISRKLNGTAGKLDGVVNAAQGLLGSPDTRSTLADIGEAARSFKKLSDNLDVRTREIAAGITRFTGQGLRQYETLATDGRRTLDGLNRAVNSLSKNPSQIIFGGKSTIPEYSGN